MRNKEMVLRRIQTLHGRLKQLEFVINRGSSEERVILMKELHGLLSDLQSIVEREN